MWVSLGEAGVGARRGTDPPALPRTPHNNPIRERLRSTKKWRLQVGKHSCVIGRLPSPSQKERAQVGSPPTPVKPPSLICPPPIPKVAGRPTGLVDWLGWLAGPGLVAR